MTAGRPTIFRTLPRELDSGFQRPPLLMLAMASLFLMLVAPLVTDFGRLALAASSIAGIGIVYLLDRLMVAVAPDLVLPRILSGMFGLQYVWLTVAAITGVTVDPAFTLGTLDLADAPLAATLPNLILPVAAFLATVAISALIRTGTTDNKSRKSIWRESSEPPSGIEAYLIIAAVLHVTFFVWAGGAKGVVAYFVRVLHSTLFFVPLYVGRYALVLKRALYVWFAVMAIVFFLGFFSGERFDALVPPVLCTAGYITACPPRRRTGALLSACVLGVLLLGVSGLMGTVRSQIGRGLGDSKNGLITSDRIDQTLGAARQAMSSEQDHSSARAAIWRMIPWANYATTRLTPEVIAYSGWSEFPKQAHFAFFNLALLSGTTVQDNIDMGMSTAPARLYGYSITESNSYEWGILGDGWYRAGIVGVFVFGFTFSLLLAACERSLPLLTRISPVLPVMLFIYWISVAADVMRSPFLNECRAIFYNTPFLLASVLVVEVVRQTLRPRSMVVVASTVNRQQAVER